mmetsp:Transcript_7992/g.11469  ORF Transcript_7992/g.11469 Transcript_7992/m.11469 type:complete len:384 (+) Transcript_7992:73-1224(+)
MPSTRPLNEKQEWMTAKPYFSFDCLEKEYSTMSDEERLRAIRDKYGVPTNDEEDEDEEDSGDDDMDMDETDDGFIAAKLEQFEDALDNIMEKEAYETALFINPEHMESFKFRLAFLRADEFDAVAAAHRMVAYWERKVELFGTEHGLQPNVSLLHFKREDLQALAKGGVRLLPQLDEHGRALLLNYNGYYDGDPETMLRLSWYMFHMGLFGNKNDNFNTSVQKNGFVSLSGNGCPANDRLPFRSFHDFSAFLQNLCHDLTAVLPLKFAAAHVFPEDEGLLKINELILYFLGPHIRSRLHVHDASHVQQQSNPIFFPDSITFGIPHTIVPAELGGGGLTNLGYTQWLYMNLQEELQTMTGREMEGVPAHELFLQMRNNPEAVTH